MKKLFYSALFIAIICSCSQQNQSEIKKSRKGEYLGEVKPDSVAKILAADFISTHLNERDFTMTPDGNEMYYTVWNKNNCFIVTTKLIDGNWTEPELTSFSGDSRYKDLEPFITSDGKRFFFMSTRPPHGREVTADKKYQNIWVMERTTSGWSEPKPLEGPINTETGQYYPSLTNDGTLYYTHEVEKNTEVIYRSKLVNGVYQKPERLPKEINPTNMQYNSVVAPDESFLIVCTHIKGNSIGRSDYYISFNLDDNNWSPLINMGNKVNFPNSFALSPSLSADGKYFIFSSNKAEDQNNEIAQRVTLSEMKKKSLSPQNGNFDLYWIETDFIEDLRKEAMAKN